MKAALADAVLLLEGFVIARSEATKQSMARHLAGFWIASLTLAMTAARSSLGLFNRIPHQTLADASCAIGLPTSRLRGIVGFPLAPIVKRVLRAGHFVVVVARDDRHIS